MRRYSLITVLSLMAVAVAIGFAFGRTVVPVFAPADRGTLGTNSYAPDQWKTYQDGVYDRVTERYAGFSFSYPRDFDVNRTDAAYGGFVDTPMVQVRFPQDAFQDPKSNFVEAFMTVSRSSDMSSSSSCYTFPSTAPTAKSETKTIHDIAFRVATSTDAGAGNFYDSRLYRTEYQGACFEFALTVHTGNIRNYPSGTVQEFDKARAFAVLEDVLATVRFTDNMP